MATLFLKEPKVSHSWKARILSRPAQFALDLTVLVGAFVITYLLRYDFVIPSQEIRHGLTHLPFVVSLQFTLLIVFGVYAFIWRYIGIAEVKAFANAALWSALPLLVLRVGLPEQYQSWRVPLSVIVVDTIIAFSSIIGVRVLRRIVYEQYEIKQKEAYALDNQKKKSILLIGAGRAGVLAAKEIQNRGDIDLVIKGFVDDDTNKRRAVVHGVKVLGTTQDLPRLVRELEIDHVVIS